MPRKPGALSLRYFIGEDGLDESLWIVTRQAVVLQVEMIDHDIRDKLLQALAIDRDRLAVVLLSVHGQNLRAERPVVDDHAIDPSPQVAVNGLHKV